tara:strand:+ start:260 stop:613 length:354 start_codon:yes stop_codon:yes gene_type:complete
MKRLFRSYPVPLWIVALMLVACTVMATGWAASYQQRLDHRDIYMNRIEHQASTITGLMAANAILMGTWQNEKRVSENLESQVHRANGRLGPMRRKINELERSMDLMRDDWTSEVGVE